MNNSVETCQTNEGLISFDHSTGIMTAEWDNGYKETWGRRGYDISTKFESFLFFTEQWDRYELCQGAA